MKLPWYYVIAVIILFLAAVAVFDLFQDGPGEGDVLYQVSTIDALMQSVYDGIIPNEELKKHGDIGIGTFNGLDGEMVAVDGNYYQIKSDGVAYPVKDDMMIPFATVTFFEIDKTILVEDAGNFTEFTGKMDAVLPSSNLFYAFRIDGQFPYIKARSVPKQEKPYPLLVDAVANQSVFEFHNVTGTIVGFYTPQYGKGINVPGYHLHFITDDRKAGGHILDFSIDEADVKLDITPEFYMELPTDGDFIGVDLTKDLHKELEKVEK
ncbi:acetolactate decarboxylase [Methanocella sp. CWC-04]|uniref:Alpha-acetolactate decarboxylase n=1 Tax=Methanooceanicella nereidis TaxID=2052831 RepID=A0AAP2RDL9_9EURY|nr:acetolactate decarboxylase [Methanocella sp. CWC-04]MCD1295373.1 acetolactate decarboxylase [Methanocella sp. CWC-04]